MAQFNAQVESLTPEERQQIDTIKDSIDLVNSNAIVQYGSGAQKNIANFSNSVLSTVKSTDPAVAGDLLNDLVKRVKAFEDENDEPLSGKVLWNDIDVTGMKAIDILYHDEVAYVGGRSWCIGGIRADENIRLLSCLYSRWNQKHFDEMLEMMEFTKEEYTTKFEELTV